MHRFLLVGLLCLSALGLANFSVSAGELAEFASKVLPESTNTVVVVRVSQMAESEVAKSLNWDDRESGLRAIGSERLPFWVETVVRGARIHPGAGRRDWTISLTNFPNNQSLTTLARNHDSRVQQLEQRPVFLSPRNAYFAQVEEDTLGVYAPADRQGLAHFLKSVKEGTPSQLSGYLQSSLASTDSLVFAVDLSNSIDLLMSKEWLRSTEAVGRSPANVEYYGNLLQSLQGFTLRLNAGQSISAEVSVDFNEDLRPTATVLKQIIDEYLLDHGAFLDDLEAAEVQVEARSLKLRMPNFSESGLRRILSIVLAPAPEGIQTANTEGVTTQPPTAAASRVYFQSIADMIDDLERKNRSARNYLKTATWHENYAKQIDQLPIRGVDPDLLKFGTETAGHFRALAASLRGVPLEVNALQNSVTYNVNYDPGWISVGYWSVGYRPENVQVDSNLAEVRAQQAEAVQRGAQERESVWLILTQTRTEIGQAMSQKYNQAFEKRAK